MNFFDILNDHAINRPNHPAIEDGDRVVSYLELNKMANWGASNICRLGIARGAVVGVMLGDNADNLIVAVALVRAGGVLLSISPHLPADDVKNTLRELKAVALIVQSTGNQDFDVPCYPAAEILTPCETTDSIAKVRGSDPFGIVESSGTTGSAKRIVVSHRDLIERWHRLMAVQKWTKAERYSSQIELYFNSSRRDYNFIFRLGATAVIPTSGSVGEFVQFINKKKITHLRLTPVHLRLMLKLVKGETPLFPDLRKLAVVSAPITGAERAAVRKFICPSLVEAYGSNESGTLTYSTPEMQMIEPESVGRVVTGVEAQIVDEDGVELPAGTPGLARFRASDFPTEYIDNPTATAEKFRDGWYYPGDIAKINDTGYLFLLGRADDVINNAGIKYYPIDIETVLLSHPAVCEAAVFPWQHELAGQVAGAAVVVEGNVTYGQLKEYCAGRLAPYKVPYVIAFRKALPKNAMGKVLKQKLASQMQNQARAHLAKSSKT